MCLCLSSCGQENKNVSFFKNSEAYDLAKAIEKEDVNKIEKLVKKEPKLLEITSSSGSNVLSLCLYIEKFNLFKMSEFTFSS